MLTVRRPASSLGRTELEPAPDVMRRALDEDPAVQEVDVPALEAEQLPQAEVAPRRQLDGNPPSLGHGGGQGVDLGDGHHRALRRSLLGGTLHHARVAADELVSHRRIEDAAQQAIGLGCCDGVLPGQLGVPGADEARRDLSKGELPEGRKDVSPEQALVEFDRTGPQVRPFAQPAQCKLLERERRPLGSIQLPRSNIARWSRS